MDNMHASTSRFVGFRLSRSEWEQLQAAAKREDSTISEAIREALYERYKLGNNSMTSPACHPARV